MNTIVFIFSATMFVAAGAFIVLLFWRMFRPSAPNTSNTKDLRNLSLGAGVCVLLGLITWYFQGPTKVEIVREVESRQVTQQPNLVKVQEIKPAVSQLPVVTPGVMTASRPAKNTTGTTVEWLEFSAEYPEAEDFARNIPAMFSSKMTLKMRANGHHFSKAMVLAVLQDIWTENPCKKAGGTLRASIPSYNNTVVVYDPKKG
jgi:hypothetical protein